MLIQAICIKQQITHHTFMNIIVFIYFINKFNFKSQWPPDLDPLKFHFMGLFERQNLHSASWNIVYFNS